MTIEDIDFNDCVGPGIGRLRNLQRALGARSFRDDRDEVRRHREGHRGARVVTIATRHVRNFFPVDLVRALIRSNHSAG